MRSFKIRLYPTKEQEILFKKHIGAERYIYNWGLALNNKLYKTEKKKYSTNDLGKILTRYKKECLWLNEISVATLKNSIRNLDAAYTNFYKKRAELPKFKSKKHCKLSFYSRYDKIYFKDNVVNLEKIGKVKYKSSYNIDLTRISKFSNPHVSYNGRCWILTLGIETKIEEIKLTNEVIGIDLGIKDLAICSNNMIFKNINKTKVVKNLEKRLRRLQRKVSKKYDMNKEGRSYIKTSNIIKLEERIKKLHRKLKNIRQDYIHKSTTSIVKTKPCRVVMEDLNVKGMMKNKHLSEAVAEQCFYKFYRQIEYKSLWNNIKFIVADRFYASSKICSCCGAIKNDLKLSDRIYKCERCNTLIDRDKNASINLMNYGKSIA